MEENKNELEQEEVRWIVPEFEEMLKNQKNNQVVEEEIEETTDEDIKNKEELEKLNKEIQKKEEEIEQIQILIDYHESGEAYRENEENFSNGIIDEKEYELTKKQIDEEFDNAKNNILATKNELQELLDKKEKLTGIKQKGVTGLEDLEHIEQEQPDENIEQVKQDVKEDIENIKKPEKNKDKMEAKEENVNSNNGVSNKNNLNNSNISDNLSSGMQNEELEELPVEEQRMQVYGKQNRFLEFFKKAIQKIKNFVKRDKVENFEKAVEKELNSNGYNIGNSQIKDFNLGDELGSYVYNENEIIQNYNKRDAHEQLIGKNERNIEQEKNVK